MSFKDELGIFYPHDAISQANILAELDLAVAELYKTLNRLKPAVRKKLEFSLQHDDIVELHEAMWRVAFENKDALTARQWQERGERIKDKPDRSGYVQYEDGM